MIQTKIFSEKNLLDVGTFSFIVLISISFMTTTELSRTIVVPVRYLAIFLTTASLLFLIIRTGIVKMQLLAVSLYLCFVLWGMTLTFFTGSHEIGSTNLVRDTLISLAGLLLFCKARHPGLLDKYAKWVLWYVFLGLIITVAVDGLTVSFPPTFNFASFRDDVDELFYSQGTSQFFGLGAIAAAYVTKTMKPGKKRYFSGTLIFLFLSLSLLGGGRGDSLGAVLVVFGYFLIQSPIRTSVLMLSLSIVALFFIDDWHWVEDLTIYNRLTVFGEGDLGGRDILLNEVGALFSYEPLCLLSGCGFGYFQSFFGYEFGMYPHNILAEALIVFGLPLTTVFLFMAYKGLKSYLVSWRKIDLLGLFFSYYLIIALKSGSLAGAWFVNACCFFFLVQGLKMPVLVRPHKLITIT